VQQSAQRRHGRCSPALTGMSSMKGSQHGVAKNRAVVAGILTIGLAGIGRPRRRLITAGSLL
jgi:hypothetical protein